MATRRGILRFRPPSGRSAFAIVLAWSLGLLFVDCGVKLRAIQAFPMVDTLSHCDIAQRPPPDRVAGRVSAGEMIESRSFESAAGGMCLHVRRSDGTMGWVPWHPNYLRSQGPFFRLRWF